MARRALTDPDEDSRATWAGEAHIAQERWRCSTARDEYGEPLYAPHESVEAMDAECRGIVEEVAAVTGCEPCADCPLAQTRGEHNAWISTVTRAYRDNEKGALASRHPHPTAVLMDALDALTGAVDARTRAETEEHIRSLKNNAPATPPHRGKEFDDE